MLLIKKWYFTFTLILCCGMVLLLGITGYSAVNSKAVYSPGQVKFHAENCIFISILAVIVVMVLFFIAGRRSTNVLRELDKVRELSRLGKYYTSDYLKKLGSLGERIDLLFQELNKLNEMMSLRISALSNLQQFFLESSRLKLLITDIQGTIQGGSRTFLLAIEQEKNQVLGKNLASLVQELKFSDVIAELEINRGGIIRENHVIRMGEKSFTSTLQFLPIFNVRNQLSEVVCISEKENILAGLSKKAEQVVKITAARRKITDLFRPKKKKQS